MKPSHTSTPRTLADCQWTQGYACARPEPRVGLRDTLAGAALSAAIFAALAAVLFAWWSA